jgi:mRNA-degrading endonuclease YafQ of YafQ-DinJ toxin-antitoxin module
MKLLFTKSFRKEYAALPLQIQIQADKKLKLFLHDLHYPSLRVKKMEDPRGIWEASITMSYRFTFQTQGDLCILRRIGTHDILRNP